MDEVFMERRHDIGVLKEQQERAIDALKQYTDSRMNEFATIREMQFENLRIAIDLARENATEDKKRAEELLLLKLNSINEAKSLALDNLNARLESMNNFRQDLRSQQANFYTREQHDAYAIGIRAEIESLKISRAELAGKATQKSVSYSIILGIVGVLVAILSFISHLVP